MLNSAGHGCWRDCTKSPDQATRDASNGRRGGSRIARYGGFRQTFHPPKDWLKFVSDPYNPELRVFDGPASQVATSDAPPAARNRPFSDVRQVDKHSATVPTPRRIRREQTADRWQRILRGAADALDCQAAAFYVLDSATTCLELRASYGLKADECSAAPRMLPSCPADVEALSGHVVTVENAVAAAHWNPPEMAPSALCVPVASATTPLGTLWLYSDRQRSFDDRQTNIAEIVAGRLASDLERDRLLDELHGQEDAIRQMAAAGRWWKSQWPTISPMIEGWEMAGWVQTPRTVSGDFYDWFLRPDHALCLAVGDALACNLDAALAAAALRSAVRAHGQYAKAPHELLRRVNRTLWTSSAGDQYASLFFAAIDTGAGQLRFATAGDPSAVVLGPGVDETFSRCETPLGAEPDPIYASHALCLAPGQVLAIVTDGVRDALDERGRLWSDAGLRQTILSNIDRSAAEMAEAVRADLARHSGDVENDDQALLVIKRMTGRR